MRADPQASRKTSTAPQQMREGRIPGKQLLWRQRRRRHLMRQAPDGQPRLLHRPQHRLQVSLLPNQRPTHHGEVLAMG